MKKTFILGLLFALACGAFGNAAKLVPPKVTMAMWDFSWLRCHYSGGSFEDWGKVLDEAKERGFNTVRIDAFPLLIDDLHQQGKQSILFTALPHDNWGPSTKDVEHNVAGELVEFMEIAKEKNVYVILSTWNLHVDRNKYTVREDFWRAWELVLDMLNEKGLLSHVLYVDFDQEFPHFTPFGAQLGNPPSAAGDSAGDMENAGSTVGSWNGAQRAFVKDYFESTLAHFNTKYPDMRFTFSMTTHWEEARSLNLKGMGVLELHCWIEGQLDKYTGFNALPKTRNPAVDYKEYMAKINDAMKNHKEDFKADMKAQLELATAWADELGVPLTTSEAWGPWWHMDHPDLEWQWLYDWCEYGMGLSGDYGFWGSTPWNYAHPYWENWKNIEWYQRVNSNFLNSK